MKLLKAQVNMAKKRENLPQDGKMYFETVGSSCVFQGIGKKVVFSVVLPKSE